LRQQSAEEGSQEVLQGCDPSDKSFALRRQLRGCARDSAARSLRQPVMIGRSVRPGGMEVEAETCIAVRRMYARLYGSSLWGEESCRCDTGMEAQLTEQHHASRPRSCQPQQPCTTWQGPRGECDGRAKRWRSPPAPRRNGRAATGSTSLREA
jgi:hypothetical protein